MSLYEEPISGESVVMMRNVLADECKYRSIHRDGVEAMDLALAIVRAYESGIVSNRELSMVARKWMH
jgi:hypothetical protein